MSAGEIIQRNELTTLLLRQGYNVFLPVYDQGIDLVAHRETDDNLKLIQQKSRWTIARKYAGRNIWIAFRDRGDWYLAPHDEMVRMGEAAGFTATESYTGSAAIYHRRECRETCGSSAKGTDYPARIVSLVVLAAGRAYRGPRD